METAIACVSNSIDKQFLIFRTNLSHLPIIFLHLLFLDVTYVLISTRINFS